MCARISGSVKPGVIFIFRDNDNFGDRCINTELTSSEAHKGGAEATQPNTSYNSDASTIIILEDEYNPRFDTPTNRSTHDATVTSKFKAVTVIPEDEYDSDVTRLDTPTNPDT